VPGSHLRKLSYRRSSTLNPLPCLATFERVPCSAGGQTEPTGVAFPQEMSSQASRCKAGFNRLQAGPWSSKEGSPPRGFRDNAAYRIGSRRRCFFKRFPDVQMLPKTAKQVIIPEGPYDARKKPLLPKAVPTLGKKQDKQNSGRPYKIRTS